MHDRYFDDRMYVLEVAYVTTRSLTRSEPEKQEWAVITRRNVPGYPPRRCDSFPTREEALAYARSVEPSTPRVSLGCASPNPSLTYEEHLAWMEADGINDPRICRGRGVDQHMNERWVFTRLEAEEIRKLLHRKLSATQEEKKRIRRVLRNDYGIYLSKFGNQSFDELIASDKIRIIDLEEKAQVSKKVTEAKKKSFNSRDNSDEAYVLDLCDEILGQHSLRQHRFDFLRGDTGRRLPVDAYYESIGLVIEYREKQHDEAVPFFDNRMTASGVSRGEQRRLYDERRRHVLPKHGIDLLEISFFELSHDKIKQLLRQKDFDMDVLRKKLRHWRR